MNIFSVFLKSCHREMLIQYRQIGRLVDLAIFFIMILVFFPLALPADANMLYQIAPGLVWIAVLLSFLLASERLFQQDYEEGSLEQYLVSGHSLAAYVLAKILVHCLIIVVALLLFSPFLSILLKLSAFETILLFVSILLASPALFALCALAAAFSLSKQQKSLLTALIVLPLMLPLMIFGSGALQASTQGFSVLPYFAILMAISLIALSFLPFAIGALLRVAVAD